MDPETALDLALSERLLAVGPSVQQRFRPYVDNLPLDRRANLLQALMVLQPQFYWPLDELTQRHPRLIRYFVWNFGPTFRVIYHALRAVKTKILVGASGPRTDRATPSQKKAEFDWSQRCAVTGKHKDKVPLECAHILPWSLVSWEQGWLMPFFSCIRLLFSPAIARRVWGLAGGSHVNMLENLMPLTPTMHKMLDNRQMWLVPSLSEHGLQRFLVHFRDLQEPGSHVTKANSGAFVELTEGFPPQVNTVCCSDPLLHEVVNTLYFLSDFFEFAPGNGGIEADLEEL
jgi:hypothetical protein